MWSTTQPSWPIEEMSGYLGQNLGAVVAAHPDVIKGVRGVGLMRGIECVVPNMDLVNALTDQKVLPVGAGGNVVRLLPPLNISDEDIAVAVEKLDAAASAIAAKD